jgi:hypothetical protein
MFHRKQEGKKTPKKNPRFSEIVTCNHHQNQMKSLSKKEDNYLCCIETLMIKLSEASSRTKGPQTYILFFLYVFELGEKSPQQQD